VEAWLEDRLVGGLYGISIGGGFFGESMFSHVSDASKVTLVYLVRQLRRWDFDFIDAQVSSTHLTSLGAEDIRRSLFMDLLQSTLAKPTRQGRWRLDAGLDIITDGGLTP
jgi:leucyl/phenylalanyl-tRNA--protein transferase